jgi:glyoxylase-like metal-dependent hydrolase (beta-lactamase superfamily II)
MHHGTKAIIETNNRAYGSRSEHSVLEAFYTKMINLFSKFGTPEEIRCFPQGSGSSRGIFPIIDRVTLGGIGFEVLDGLGGHTFGQVFLFAPDHGLLFAADSVINFSSLSKERADFTSLAAFLVTSVNVDSERARAERKALLELATETDNRMKESGRRCLIFGGHGAVSVLEEKKLVPFGEIERYVPGKRN